MRKLGIIGNSENYYTRIEHIGISEKTFPKGIILETPDTTKEWAKKSDAVPFLSADLLVDYADALVVLDNNESALQTAIQFIKANKLVHFDSIDFPQCENMTKLLKIAQEGDDLISLNNHKWPEELIKESNKHFSSPLLGKFELHIPREEILTSNFHEELVDVLELILSLYKGGIKKVRSCGIHSGKKKDLLHVHIQTQNGSLIFLEITNGEYYCLQGEISEPGSSASFILEENRAEFTMNDSKIIHNNIGFPNYKHFNSSIEKQSFHYIRLEDIYNLNTIAREILETFHSL